tara:strand:+ start:2046 stop:2159 length:114 start_codon:yes stop_codon:yes gene_type:complete
MSADESSLKRVKRSLPALSSDKRKRQQQQAESINSNK